MLVWRRELCGIRTAGWTVSLEGKLGIGFYSRCGPWRTMDVEARALLLDHQSISQT
jgi:hypothetical protein